MQVPDHLDLDLDLDLDVGWRTFGDGGAAELVAEFADDPQGGGSVGLRVGRAEDAPQGMPAGQPVIRTIAMSADTNPAGDIFGGWLMSQMDLAAGNLAALTARGRFR